MSDVQSLDEAYDRGSRIWSQRSFLFFTAGWVQPACMTADVTSVRRSISQTILYSLMKKTTRRFNFYVLGRFQGADSAQSLHIAATLSVCAGHHSLETSAEPRLWHKAELQSCRLTGLQTRSRCDQSTSSSNTRITPDQAWALRLVDGHFIAVHIPITPAVGPTGHWYVVLGQLQIISTQGDGSLQPTIIMKTYVGVRLENNTNCDSKLRWNAFEHVYN